MMFKPLIKEGGMVGLDHYWDYEKDVKEDGTLDCYAIGCSLVLIKTSCYRDVNPPFFLTGTNHTEDVYFCAEVKRTVPDVRICVNTKCPTGHLLDMVSLSVDSVVKLREFYATPENKDLQDWSKEPDRRKAYVEGCLKQLQLDANPQKEAESPASLILK